MDFLIPGSRSLKDRRRAMNSLKTQLRNRYNCSVAEVGDKDRWGRSNLAVCVVSDDGGHLSKQLDEIVRFASRHKLAQLADYSIETL